MSIRKRLRHWRVDAQITVEQTIIEMILYPMCWVLSGILFLYYGRRPKRLWSFYEYIMKAFEENMRTVRSLLHEGVDSPDRKGEVEREISRANKDLQDLVKKKMENFRRE